MKGLILTTDGDFNVIGRHLAVGDTLLQDASVVLQLKQGELKEDPLLGPNLLRLLRGKSDKNETERLVKIHLSRAGISYEEVKSKLEIILKNHENK